MWLTAARIAGRLRLARVAVAPWPERQTPDGISVVIPSRNGKDLLAAQMAGIVRELQAIPSEIVVVDNGSGDGTAEWLGCSFPQVALEVSESPLSFARAVNRGIARARFSHVCLLNNDMILEPGFFVALRRAFARVPDLFCSTAQILFPKGVRREETGKAVMFQPGPDDFPIRCDEPAPGEDLTWVLYGSGGCSLYDAAKLRALGGIDAAYDPVYVEDLDIGYRAWQRGWPSVYVNGAVLEHRHRATSSRYYTEEELEEILETNYLRFLARAVWRPAVFRRLWEQALTRLRRRAETSRAARQALRGAWRIALDGGPSAEASLSEDAVLALTDGSVAIFPGRSTARPPQVMVASVKKLAPPAPEIVAAYAEVVMVRGPEDSAAFRAAVEQTARKWRHAGLHCRAL